MKTRSLSTANRRLRSSILDAVRRGKRSRPFSTPSREQRELAMPLQADIATLRDQILVDLAAAHDYYTNTKQAWRVVQLYVDSGKTVEFLNAHTGNKVPPADLPAQAQFYVTEYLAAATFQQFVSLFEDFVLGLIRLWLRSFQMRLWKRNLVASIVFEA